MINDVVFWWKVVLIFGLFAATLSFDLAVARKLEVPCSNPGRVGYLSSLLC